MHPLQIYENILFRNISHITTIELFIRFLYYTLPGRFSDAKFASQTLYSGLNLIRLYHNSILRRAADQAKQQYPVANSNEELQFNKYKRYWTSKSDLFRKLSIILAVIDYTQVWMEMELLRKGFRKTRWIAGLELLKSVLNLTIFRLTDHRMHLYPNHMERHAKPSSLDPQRHQQTQTYHWTGRRTGKDVPLMTTTINISDEANQQSWYHRKEKYSATAKYTDVNNYLMSKALTAEKLRQPQQMVRVMSFWAGSGEVVSIMRPTIYVFAILVWGRRSWKPWYLSLVMDLLSNYIIRRHCSSSSGGERSRMLPLEKNEYLRRLKLLVYYLMKGPFYIWVTRPKLERLCNNLEGTPLPKMLLVVCRDYLSLWENIYFYSSGS